MASAEGKLLEYSKGRKCPKCDGDASTVWCPDSADFRHHNHDNRDFSDIDEHQHRHCTNCHYEWPEAVNG